MKYPDEVQPRVDVLDEYTINNDLLACNIIHMYPKGLAYPDGFYDARFFDMHIFKIDTMEKRIIPDRDGIHLFQDAAVHAIGIFADGSTIIQLRGLHAVDLFQCVYIKLLKRR